MTNYRKIMKIRLNKKKKNKIYENKIKELEELLKGSNLNYNSKI